LIREKFRDTTGNQTAVHSLVTIRIRIRLVILVQALADLMHLGLKTGPLSPTR